LTISLNALLVPMFGMLHMVLMGPVLAILLAGFERHFPAKAGWVWGGTVALFVAGLLAFILPLLLTNSTGWQINAAEGVYRFTMPLIFSGAAGALIFWGRTHETIGHYSRL